MWSLRESRESKDDCMDIEYKKKRGNSLYRGKEIA